MEKLKKLIEKYQKLLIWFIVALAALFVALLSHNFLTKFICLSVLIFIVGIYFYIYLIRFKPGTGEKVRYTIFYENEHSKTNDEVLGAARAMCKIPLDYFHARITSTKISVENMEKIVTYEIEYWECKENREKSLSTQ